MFRDCFEVLREMFVVFSGFSKFSDLLGPVRTCSEVFGYIQMHLHAFGCIWTLLENFEKFLRKTRFVYFW